MVIYFTYDTKGLSSVSAPAPSMGLLQSIGQMTAAQVSDFDTLTPGRLTFDSGKLTNLDLQIISVRTKLQKCKTHRPTFPLEG
jgi:hypothetical protein